MTRVVARVSPADRERIDRTRRARMKVAQLFLAFVLGWCCHAVFAALANV